MRECDECGREVSMPYSCNFCDDDYCSEHRLPENHSCEGLSSYEQGVRDDGKVYDGPSPSTSSSSGGGFSLPFSLPSSMSGVVTYYLLAGMVGVFVIQIVLLSLGFERLHNSIFVMHPNRVEFVWSWVASIFAHGGLGHLMINAIVLFFFGAVLERRIGSKRFLALFFVGGIVAGLAQSLATLATVDVVTAQQGALGASGAIAAVLGALTVLNPNLRVYLWFFIPMPLWVLTIGFAGYDLFFAATGGVGAGGVARAAHLSGLALGLAYGVKLKREGYSMKDRLDLGGGRGPGPGGGRGPRI